MAGFIIFKKLTLIEALDSIIQIQQFFRENPRRKICRTDLFKVRRNHIIEDILKHTLEAQRR